MPKSKLRFVTTDEAQRILKNKPTEPIERWDLAYTVLVQGSQLAAIAAALRPHDPLCMGRYGEPDTPCNCTSGKIRAILRRGR